MAEGKTRNVERRLYINYLKRADECLEAAKTSVGVSHWTASIINSIHAGIAAVDALCVYYLGKRHAGQRHEDAIKLFSSIDLEPKELRAHAQRISRLLGTKTPAEYEERLVRKPEAEKALKDVERLLAFARSKLPKEKL